MAKLRSGLAALTVLAATGSLAGCGGDQQGRGAAGPAVIQHTKDDGFAGTLVADPPLRPADIVLRDTHGNTHNLARPSQEKVTALFFGFTNCDDVCPTTMADLAGARRALPPGLAQKVDVVFVTVDPRRDTPRVLQQWLNQFDTGFVGLRGPMSQVHRAERSLYADPSAVEPSTGDHHKRGRDDSGHSNSSTGNTDYEVSHSGSVYVFGPGGQSLLYSGGTTVTQYAKDFTKLLKTR